MRNRSACGPTYFGPGKRGVACEYGQNDSQIVHFTQWSRESRTSSVTGLHRLENRRGRSVSRPQAEAVPGALAPRDGAGERGARGMEVLIDRLALVVHGTHLRVDRDAGPGKRVLVEVAWLEPRLVWPRQARHRQVEDGLPNDPGRVQLQSARGKAAGREDERPRPIGERPARGVRLDGFDTSAVDF